MTDYINDLKNLGQQFDRPADVLMSSPVFKKAAKLAGWTDEEIAVALAQLRKGEAVCLTCKSTDKECEC